MSRATAVIALARPNRDWSPSRKNWSRIFDASSDPARPESWAIIGKRLIAKSTPERATITHLADGLGEDALVAAGADYFADRLPGLLRFEQAQVYGPGVDGLGHDGAVAADEAEDVRVQADFFIDGFQRDALKLIARPDDFDLRNNRPREQALSAIERLCDVASVGRDFVGELGQNLRRR